MKSIKRKIYSLALVAGLSSTLSIIGAGSFVLSSNSLKENSVTQSSTSLNSDIVSTVDSQDSSASTNTYLLPFNQTINASTKQSSVSLDSPVQYMAFNSNKTSYALLTSSDTTYQKSTPTTADNSKGYDYLTSYKMSPNSSGDVKNWTTQASSISLNTATSQDSKDSSSNNAKEFLAVSYYKSINQEFYLAIVSDTSNNYYLVKLDATTGQKSSVIKLETSNSSTKDSDKQKPKFYIDVTSSLYSKINIYKIDTNINLSISLFSINSSTSQSVSSTSISISNELLSSYFYSSTSTNSFSSKLVNSYYDNSYVYFVFQQSTLSSSTINNYLTVLRINKYNPQSTITSQQLHSFSLSLNNFNDLNSKTKDNSLTNVSVSVAGNDSNRTFVISSSSSSTFLYSTLTNNIFDSTTVSTFSRVISPESNAFIVSIYNLYTIDETMSSENTLGYVALLSNNKTVEISPDFSSITLLYDFSKLKASNNDSTLIFNIFTIPGDGNWYAQMTDGSIIQFNGTNLIGQLGSETILSRTEFMAKTSIISQSEVPSTVLFQKVVSNSTTGTATASTEFVNYINSNISSFLETSSYDTAFGSPSYEAKVNSVTKNSDQNYSVSISFYQKLRKLLAGQIQTNSTTDVYIGTQQYTFINSDLAVTTKEKRNIPAEITSLLPSQVTQEQVLEILNIENAGNYLMTLDPNDTDGTLTVKIKCDAAWVDSVLNYNYTKTVVIGTKENPYFMVDVFNGLSSSVDLVTQSYVDQADNAALKTKLSNKYSGTLPSQVTAQNIIDDFIIFGDAFTNNQLVNSGIISKPTINNIQLFPSDASGNIYVVVNIPKIGSKTNVTYSFTTPTIFKKNFTTNEEVFLNFLDNSKVLEAEYKASDTAATATKLSSLQPSTIVSLINNNKSFLFYFINMSGYMFNLIANTDINNGNVVSLNTVASDALGTLQIIIKINQSIEGLNSEYSCTFTGFTKSNSNQSGAPSEMPTFSWGTIDINAFSGKKPTDITASMLETDYSSLFVYNNTANQLTKSISVTPMNASGAVLVTITFYDWWEKQTTNGQSSDVKIPEKTFTTVLKNSLTKVPDSVDSIIWKSFSELSAANGAYTNSTASNALTLINSSASTDFDKLKLLANLSTSLQTSLQQAISENSGAFSLSLTADDTTGTLSAYASATINGTTYNFSNILSGFDLSGADYSVSLASDTSDALTSLKDTLPSNLTDEQIGSLITINLGNGLKKKVTTSYDDIKGTLTVTVSLYKDSDSTTAVASTQRTYSGFLTEDIHYAGTNFILIGASVIIPIILLLSPIIYIYLFKNKRDVKKLSKVLDKRIEQNIRNKNKNVDVNSVEDLLKLDSDRF